MQYLLLDSICTGSSNCTTPPTKSTWPGAMLLKIGTLQSIQATIGMLQEMFCLPIMHHRLFQLHLHLLHLLDMEEAGLDSTGHGTKGQVGLSIPGNKRAFFTNIMLGVRCRCPLTEWLKVRLLIRNISHRYTCCSIITAIHRLKCLQCRVRKCLSDRCRLPCRIPSIILARMLPSTLQRHPSTTLDVLTALHTAIGFSV